MNSAQVEAAAQSTLDLVTSKLAEQAPHLVVTRTNRLSLSVQATKAYNGFVSVRYAEPRYRHLAHEARLAVAWDNGWHDRDTHVRMGLNADKVVAKVLEGVASMQAREQRELEAAQYREAHARKLAAATAALTDTLDAVSKFDAGRLIDEWKATLSQDGTARYSVAISNLTEAEVRAILAVRRAAKGTK